MIMGFGEKSYSVCKGQWRGLCGLVPVRFNWACQEEMDFVQLQNEIMYFEKFRYTMASLAARVQNEVIWTMMLS